MRVERRAVGWALSVAAFVRVVLFVTVDLSLSAAGLGRHITVLQAYMITAAVAAVSSIVAAAAGWLVYRKLRRGTPSLAGGSVRHPWLSP